VLACQVDRCENKALHQQADGNNHDYKQESNRRNDRQTGDEITARILVQGFGIFLVNRKHLVENDFILTVEAGHLRDKRIKLRDIVRSGGVNQRCQPLVTVVLPGILIRAHQRRFIRQARRRHKRRKGMIRFCEGLFNRGKFR
jgi:hypothetical protein